jgi:hypothetical protein
VRAQKNVARREGVARARRSAALRAGAPARRVAAVVAPAARRRAAAARRGARARPRGDSLSLFCMPVVPHAMPRGAPCARRRAAHAPPRCAPRGATRSTHATLAAARRRGESARGGAPRGALPPCLSAAAE